MTTHLRARALQAGAFLALVGGVLVAAPSAARADNPTVSVVSLRPADITSGGTTTIGYRIENNPGDTNVSVQVSGDGLRCDPGCTFEEEVTVGAPRTFSTKLIAGNLAPGETKKITVTVTATVKGVSDSDSREVTVRGPDKPQTVRQVSGRVKDQDGKAVSGALVGLRDSQGHQYQTNTNGDGGYSFTSSDSKPISVGAMAVGATKDGYELTSKNAQGAAGKSITVPLTLKSKTAPTPSSPSPSPSATTDPTDEATDEASEPATDESAGVLDAAPKSGSDEGSGSLLFIILGGLLVAAGIGAIVLVLMRRKSNEDPDELDGAGAGGAVPAAAPAGRYGGAD
ncbi:carboxypeptidase-like regulatory domain-containing protein, partial [Actinoplanes sp. NPDC048791]|uniref:carboxypeptidase-like regulatory domain-containing protein n=1 Tax=Actinoplanes sp. NPDC048791 TaxID=3154623 RepID=UPI0033CB3357